MFKNIFVKQLIEDIKNGKAEIKIGESNCVELSYYMAIIKENKVYKFSGLTKEQITMIEYLLGL